MCPPQMGPEVIGSRPPLVLVATALKIAHEGLSLGFFPGVAASHMAVDIVVGAEAFSPGASGDGTSVRLLVFLLVFAAAKEIESNRQPSHMGITEKMTRAAYLISDLVFTLTLQ